MENPRGYPFISRCLIIGVVIVAVFYLVLVAILFFSTRAHAADPCWERNSLSIRFDTLGVTSARKLKDDERTAAVRWYNSQEPKTDIDWQTIILAEMPDGSGLILIGREEAVCTRMHIPKDHWLKVKLNMIGLPV
jgi:hypothetical protein